MANRMVLGFDTNGAPLQGSPVEDRPVNAGIDGEFVYGIVKENTAWDVYNNEARKVDSELVKDWTSSLNFLLVFAAIFSAVLAAFIIESKKMLEADYNALMVDVMIFYTNTIARGVQEAYTAPTFLPTNSAVSINCLLFGSLVASLVAALASVVSLQWVAGFDAAITRGGSSPQERAERRQFRFAGVEKWKMGEIIAALPLLLYFSVLLFFAGLIQWMLILNAMVGYIVLGGALIVAMFYLSSTLLAVLFVSAPFKTPLSLWIYATYHLRYAIIHWVIAVASFQEIPEWVKARWRMYHTAHKREDLAVGSRVNLKYQAMHWLARQVSISEDSRRRLILLATQLPQWPPVQLESREFKDTPWVRILNFLAQRHRSAFQNPLQTKEEEQDLALLVNCATLPGFTSLIRPTEIHDYDHNIDGDMYWSQHCITTDQSPAPVWIRSTVLVQPEPIFLLTRDLPVPSLLEGDEMTITLRLAKWRNLDKKPLDVWKSVFSAATTVSDNFFSSCIIMLSNYLTANIRPQAYMVAKGALGHIIADITNKAITSGITSTALTALVRLFEVTMLQQDGIMTDYRSSRACLQGPLYYGRRLPNTNQEARGIHRKLVLLLARDLQGLPNSEQAGRLQELRAMVWITPSARPSDDRWATLMRKYGQVADLKDLEEEIVDDWIFYVDKSDEATETVLTLTQTSPNNSQIGLRALSSFSRRSGKHMLALLRVFDTILCDDRQFKSAATTLKSLCKILQMCEPALLQPISDEEFSIYVFKTFYVRVIAYRALGIEHMDEGVMDRCFGWSDLMDPTVTYLFWNMSMKDPSPVWQLRAWLIFNSSGGNFCELVKRFIEDALRDPGNLLQLQRILEERTLCPHGQGPGHLLHHLQSAAVPKITFRSDVRLFEVVSLNGVELPPVTALLAISSVDEISILSLPQRVDGVCMTTLWGYIQSLKTSQSSMLEFLAEFPVYYSRTAILAATAIHLKVIEDSIALPPEDDSILLLRPLSRRILVMSRPYLPSQEQEKRGEEITALSVQGRRIADLVIARFATVTISGQWSLRLLSCARPSWGTRPATGWWLNYE